MTMMQKLNPDDLRRFAPPPVPRAPDDPRPGIYDGYMQTLVTHWDLLVRAEINTPLRFSHFISIGAHETGGFTLIREDTSWSYQRMCQLWPNRFRLTDPVMRARYLACRGEPELLADLAYGAWNDLGQRLGNTEVGDGWEYRGVSWFQGTGRNWFREVGAPLGMDLERDPEQIEDPETALRAAIWYWQRYRLARFADRNYGRAIHGQINLGSPFRSREPNHWKERQRWFDRAWAVWGVGQQLPSPIDVALGAHGQPVMEVQQRLRDLGYAVGRVDGIFGPELGRGIAAFKSDWKEATRLPVEPDDLVGPATRAALATAEPIRRPEREQMTERDLLAAGSTEMAAGNGMRKLAYGVLGLGAVGGATADPEAPMRAVQVAASEPVAPIDPTPVVDATIGWVEPVQRQIKPVIEAGTWAVQHWWWVLLILIGVWLYSSGWRVMRARLEAARRGINLWR